MIKIKKNKTVIFANGIPNKLINLNKDASHIQADDTIICADGGTLYAMQLGLTPDIVVGDLDSLPSQTHQTLITQGIKIIQHPVDKDKTDLELALTVAIEQGATEILLLTALGGRLDQLIANILLLTRPEWQTARLRLADGNQLAWIMHGPDKLTISGQPGNDLSILALTPTIHGLNLDGVKWPLYQATINLGSTLTISNMLTQNQATIQLKTGTALVIQQCKT